MRSAEVILDVRFYYLSEGNEIASPLGGAEGKALLRSYVMGSKPVGRLPPPHSFGKIATLEGNVTPEAYHEQG